MERLAPVLGVMTYAAIAAQLVDILAPNCERIEIAGSIRRGSTNPHDIELVCVPKIDRVELPPSGQMSLGGDTPRYEDVNQLDNFLSHWKDTGKLLDRKGSDGKRAWGPRFKRAVYVSPSGLHFVPVDIFSVIPEAQWGVIFAIRTGPADFSHTFVTSRLQGGTLPVDMTVAGGQLRHGGKVVQTPEESGFFEAMGLPYWEPEMRDAQRLRTWLAKQRHDAHDRRSKHE